ncbi:hypothetical protein D3C87_1675170 [compost metagenome]
MQVIAEVDVFNLADIQTFETNRRAAAQAIGALHLDRDHSAFFIGVFAVGVQTEPRNPLLQWRCCQRRFEGDAASHQALQRFTFDLDPTGQPTRERNAAGIPEPGRRVDQAFIFLLDVYADH